MFVIYAQEDMRKMNSSMATASLIPATADRNPELPVYRYLDHMHV